MRKATETDKVQVVNDITMSLTSTADAARLILALLEKNAAPGIYHVVNFDLATWSEFALQILNEVGSPDEHRRCE